jgi:hypothetical protein
MIDPMLAAVPCNSDHLAKLSEKVSAASDYFVIQKFRWDTRSVLFLEVCVLLTD